MSTVTSKMGCKCMDDHRRPFHPEAVLIIERSPTKQPPTSSLRCPIRRHRDAARGSISGGEAVFDQLNECKQRVINRYFDPELGSPTRDVAIKGIDFGRFTALNILGGR